MRLTCLTLKIKTLAVADRWFAHETICFRHCQFDGTSLPNSEHRTEILPSELLLALDLEIRLPKFETSPDK